MFAGCHTQDLNVQAELQKLAAHPRGLADIPYDNRGNWVEGPINMFQQRLWNTPESHDEDGVIGHEGTQTRICAWARIDNRKELIEKLPTDLHTLAATDTGLILAVYLVRGEDLCAELIGDFAFAIYDGRNQQFILGRDHIGVRPLYYYWSGQDFAFATSIAVLDGVETLNLKLSEEWMARYLLGCSGDESVTSFEQIYKVPPAHIVIFDGGDLRAQRYFEFSEEVTLNLKSDQEYVEAYQEVLKEAVSCRVRSSFPIGSESSGGLDSATVTSLASEAMSNPARDLHAFGFANLKEEPECILSVSQMWAVHSTYLVTDTALDLNAENLWPQFWRANGTASEHSNGFYHHPFYEEARKWGVRTMLSGFGGDEFVTSAGGTSRVEFLLSKRYRMLSSRFPGNPLAAWLRALKWTVNFYRSNNISNPTRALMEYAEEHWEKRIVAESYSGEKLHALAGEFYNYDGGCLSQNEFSLKNVRAPFMTSRFENCTLMAASYGLEYRWPLTDVRLLNLFLSIPAEQKLGPKGVNRYLHRRAVANKIPKFIAWKSKSMGDAISGAINAAYLDYDFSAAIDLTGSPLQSIVDSKRLTALLERLEKSSAEEWHNRDIFERLYSLDRWLKSRESSYQKTL